MKNLFLLTVALITITYCNAQNKKETSMKNVEIQLIRNATLKVSYSGKTFLVDPMLGEKNSFMSFVEPNKNLNPTVDLPFSIDEVTKNIDVILLTHSHPDHFDAKAIEVLNKSLPIYTQPIDVELVKKATFTNVEAIEKSKKMGNITITRTGGKHGPEESLEQLGQVSGFILQSENYPTIYIIGDCIWDTEIESNIKSFNPDIIVTNSGGAIFMGQNRILMDERETIKVAKAGPKATIISIHAESLDHCMTTRKMILAEAEKENVSILVPKDGEIIKL